MKRIKYVVALGLLINLILLAFFGWVVYRSLNATYVYNWHIEYATMPVTDDALADWLKSQPGITHATISREKSSIVVNYEMKGEPTMPDLIGKSKDFGYSSLVGFTGDFKIQR
jgi:hypothetical protein